MDERLRRRWAGCEALAIGRGGVSAVARETGLSRNTVLRGIREVRENLPELVGTLGKQRIRRPGGGRPAATMRDQSLWKDLQSLLESSTRGDADSPLMWTSKSTRKLAEELTAQGHSVSHMTVDRLLRQTGYSLQASHKTREGDSHPDRNAQFEYLSGKVNQFQQQGQPVVSVDTKKRELVGNFRNRGREWHPQGQPPQVQVHDFRDQELGVAIPYGVYDLTRNEGWVSVGVDHDTAEFAAATIGKWWRKLGRPSYPHAHRLLITADSGGSNGSRLRLWKWCLQKLADQTGLQIQVCHFPPGTSKWNRIEHQMFCHIAENWRGRPLLNRAIIVNLIGHTTTCDGLRIKAALDESSYSPGIAPTKEQMASIRLTKDAFHGDWNYCIGPRKY